MEYHEEHWSWSTCREQCLFAAFGIYSFLSKHLSRKTCSFSDLCIIVCFLLQNQFQCISWHAENTNRVIFSSYHVEMTHLNCKTVGPRDFWRILGLCLLLGDDVKKFFLPHTHTPQNRVCFVSFLQVRTFHSVWYVRHWIASTVVPKYGPHLVNRYLKRFH